MTSPQDPFAAPGDQPQDPHSPQTPPQSPPQDPGQSPPGGYGQPAYGQPAYGQPAYGQAPGFPPPGYGGPGQGGMKNGLGVAALVLGVLSLFSWFFIIGGLFGLVAIVLGVLARGKVKRGEANNGGLALAGIVTGAIGLLLTIVVVVAVGSLFSNEEFSNLRECLEAAGNDSAAVDECREQFEDSLSSAAR